MHYVSNWINGRVYQISPKYSLRTTYVNSLCFITVCHCVPTLLPHCHGTYGLDMLLGASIMSVKCIFCINPRGIFALQLPIHVVLILKKKSVILVYIAKNKYVVLLEKFTLPDIFSIKTLILVSCNSIFHTDILEFLRVGVPIGNV